MLHPITVLQPVAPRTHKTAITCSATTKARNTIREWIQRATQDALQRTAQDAEDRVTRMQREAAADAAEAAQQLGEAKGQLAALRGQLEAAQEAATHGPTAHTPGWAHCTLPTGTVDGE